MSPAGCSASPCSAWRSARWRTGGGQKQGRGGRRAPRLHALPGPDAPAGPPGRGAAAGRADLAAPRAGRAVVDRRVPPAVGAADHRRRLRRGPGRGRRAEAGGQHRHAGDQAGRGPGADDARSRCAGSCVPTRPCRTCRSRCQLRAFSRVVLRGDRGAVTDLTRAALCQLATFHSPDDLRIAVVAAPERQPRLGLGQVAAARAVRARGSMPPGAQPAGLRHDGRAGGRARRRAGRAASARPGGQAADHRRAPGGGARRR